MLKLQEVRSLYPEYKNLTDFELSTAIHRARFADMPYEQFAQGFGGPAEEDKAETAARQYNAANPGNPITAQDIRDKDRSGVMGGLRLLGEGIYDAVTDQFPEDMARIWRGGDIDPATAGAADDVIKQQAKDKAARIPSLQEAEGSILANSLYQGPQSVATSMATGIAGAMVGGAAGSAAGPVGSLVGSMVGGGAMSGAAFYRMAKDQFVEEVQQAMQRSTGRSLSSGEANELNAAIDADASEFGMWEAGPEALSQFFTLGLVRGAGGAVLKKIGLGGMSDAIGKRALTRIPAKMAAELGEEETTEGITYFGQEGIRQQYGLRQDAPSLGEFAKEQAGPVAVGSILQLGGMRAAQAVGSRMQRRAEDVGNNNDAQAQEDKLALPPSPLALPPSPIAMRGERDGSGAIPMEGRPEDATKEFLSDDEFSSTERWVKEQERLAGLEQLPGQVAFSDVASAGEAIDLLSWGGKEENPVFSMQALPQPQQQQALPLAGIQALFALPQGDGAMPMGTQQTGMGPIAPPTEFAHAPIAPPYVERPALPVQSTQGLPQGQWAGGRSQLAYGPQQAQGLAGALGVQQQAMPTQAQITSTQQAPRADTTAQADALGMPAPMAMPVQEVQPAPVAAPVIARPVQEQAAPAGAIDRMTYAQLIDMVPQELKVQARGKKKDEIREIVRTQTEGKVNAEVQAEAESEAEIGRGAPDANAATNAKVASGIKDNDVYVGMNADDKPIFEDSNTRKRYVVSIDGILVWQSPTKESRDDNGRMVSMIKSPSELFRDGQTKFLTPEETEEFKKENQPQNNQSVKNNSGKSTLSAKSDVVKSDQTVEENHVTVRNGEPAGKPVVDEQADMVAGQQPSPGPRTVEQPEPRSIAGTPRQDGGTSGVSERPAGRDAEGREGRDDSRSDLPAGRGRAGRGNVGTEESGDIALGGDKRVPEHAGRKRESGGNHRITPEDTLVPGGAVSRAKANIAAINLVRKLDDEGRAATPDEKKILTQFTGWGSLAQAVFNPNAVSYVSMEKRYGSLPSHLNADAVAKYKKWKSQYGEALHPHLGGVLTEKEWAAAEKSTLNAHYTDRKVISSMWDMAEKLGFSGGRVLEPSAGTGLFFGLMPEHLSQGSSLVGIELDEMTGKILKHLYPDADIQITGFEKAKRVGDNTVDLVISNVPFGDFPVFDKARPKYSKQSIHNYFFSRSLDAVRPGGLVMQITSHYTLDSGSAARLREEWGNKADLVAAVRLPGTAFEKNAGTEVTTDIIIFRKKSDSRFELGKPFRNTGTVTTKQGDASVNEYFIAHPEMVLGEHSLSGTMYGGNEYALLPKKDESLDEGLRRVVDSIPSNVYGVEAANTLEQVESADGKVAREGDKEGALVEDGGNVYIVSDGRLEAPEWAGKKGHVEQAKAYAGVKDVALRLISAMNADADDARVSTLRRELNDAYDVYTKKHGPINKAGNAFLEDDIEFPTVAALENVDQVRVEKVIKSGPNKGQKRASFETKVSKADIFSTRTIFPFKSPERADNAEDAVKISRVYRNGIDLPYIASLLGMSTDDAKAALIKTGDVFENPSTGLLEPRDIYLSGNVREKLQQAEVSAEDNPAYEANVSALRDVQPQRVGIDGIFARIGSAWVPPDVYSKFLQHIGVKNAEVTLARLPGDDGTATWDVRGYGLSAEAKNKWGTERADVLSLIKDCLNLKRTVILDAVPDAGKTKYVRNERETMAAMEKQRLLQEEFKEWLVGDDESAKSVEDTYNEKFNGFVVRKLDVPDIKHYPGASQNIELRENQKIGVARALQESCLLAHGVGSGKTMLQITLAMEMRRLGTGRKPWIVVQGSTLSQFAASFKTLYPGARILAPTEKQRSAKNRRRLLAQIASGDWDAVITPHGFFNGVSVSPETEERFIREQVDEYEELLHDVSKDDKVTRKQIEKKIERLKVRLEDLADTRKDENIFFDELGVDALIIDEAHAYKRGQFVTKMDNVKGLDRDSSQRSFQMLMKSRLVQAKTGGKNVILATGTPISNTLTEMWTMFRYTRPDLLREFGVEQFDDFATTFANTSISQEETATGEWKDVERFNQYVNGPELLTLWRSGADVAITEDLTSIKGLPTLLGGKIHEAPVERSEALSNYIEALRQERIAWDNLSGKEKREKSYVPLTIYGRAKQAAIDLRLVDSTLDDEPDSKANVAVRNVYERWNNSHDSTATQIVFSDTFQSRDGNFNLFEDIKKKLVEMGIPQKEIALIHDYKTDDARKKLFDAVNSGDVRVLMGTTEKLGVGVNVQERLLTAHHIDAPQRPMDFEQRNGRIRRPGNVFPEVEILTYGTKNTLDSVTFQQLISKQKFINQLLRGNVSDRSFENPFDSTQATFEDMMAAFSGNPLAKEKMQLTADVRRLKAMLSAHTAQISGQRNKMRSQRDYLERQEGRLPEAEKLSSFIEGNFKEGKISGKKELAKEIGDWLGGTEAEVSASVADIKTKTQWQTKSRASYTRNMDFDLGHGVKVAVTVEPHISFAEFADEQTEYSTVSKYRVTGPHGIKMDGEFSGAQGLLTRVSNGLAPMAKSKSSLESAIAHTKDQITTLEDEVKRPFAQQAELEAAEKRLEEVEAELEATTKVEAERAEEGEGEDTPMASITWVSFDLI